MHGSRRTTITATLVLALLCHGALFAACKEKSFAGRFFRPAYAAAPTLP